MIVLKPGKEAFLRAHHPWIYRGAVESAGGEEGLQPVRSAGGRRSPGGSIPRTA